MVLREKYDTDEKKYSNSNNSELVKHLKEKGTCVLVAVCDKSERKCICALDIFKKSCISELQNFKFHEPES